MVEDTDKQGTTVKRRLRASTETVRQRTEKAQEQQRLSDAPSTPNFARSFWRGFTWPLRQLGKGFGWLGRFRLFQVLGRIIFPRYFRNSWKELKLVTWPDRRTSWKLTYAVIIFSLLFGAIVAVVDFGLDKLFKEFIIK